jgi:hypothetical protein
MRVPNEIDFWRGFALFTIFINHIPGLYFEHFTYRNVSLSDAAELFVFLAGFAMRKLVDGRGGTLSTKWLVVRLESRAIDIYVAQLVITEIALALLAAFALFFDAPFLLDWHNAQAVFNDPVRTHVGVVLLTHQLGYFNILPLYVVLVFAAPLILLVHRLAPALLLPASLALYAGAITLGVNLPTWPIEGTWFFNPLTWQLIYVLGFVLAGDDGTGAILRRYRKVLWWLALPVAVAGAVVAQTHFTPDPINLPEPKLFFMFDKTFLSPARLIHSLALVALFAGAFKLLNRWLSYPCAYLALLGRNSLNVFCTASLLSLIGQVVRFAYGGDVATDALIIIMGLFLMGLVAWASEWRERMSDATPKDPYLPSR